jgi:hypothetical protein
MEIINFLNCMGDGYDCTQQDQQHPAVEAVVRGGGSTVFLASSKAIFNKK